MEFSLYYTMNSKEFMLLGLLFALLVILQIRCRINDKSTRNIFLAPFDYARHENAD